MPDQSPSQDLPDDWNRGSHAARGQHSGTATSDAYGTGTAGAHRAGTVDSDGTEAADAYGAGKADVLGARPADAYGAGNADPFGTRDADPFGRQNGDPFGTRDGDPFGTRDGDPFGHRNADPFGTRDADPFGRQNADPFGPVAAAAFGAGTADAYRAGPADAFGAGTADAYRAGTADAFGAGTADAHGEGRADAHGPGTADGRTGRGHAEPATAAMPRSRPGEAAGSKGFLGSLFDFGFTSFVTPKVIKVLYVLIMLSAVASALVFTFMAFKVSAVFGVLTLVIGDPLFILIVMAIYRVILEFFVVAFRMAEDVKVLRERGGAR